MNLVIDQGNTYSKLAFFNENELVLFKKLENKAINDIKETLGEQIIEKAIIASVADASEIIELLTLLDINFIMMNQMSHLPISINYETPKSLGLDRIAAAVGANSKQHHKASLIIDIGTAITYDVCTAEGVFIGGSIAPGLDMRLLSLHTFTKQLPLVDRGWGANPWAKSTPEAIKNGAQEGIIAEINYYIEKAQQQFKNISIFLTGGDAVYFEKKIKNDIFVAPNLVLEGLLEILKIN